MRTASLCRALAAGVSLLAVSPCSAADDRPIAILVVKEHGVGNQALAQPYIDKMVSAAAAQNKWPGATGRYFTSRAPAEAFIKTEQPHYAILSLPAFLAMRGPYKLQVIGRVAVSLAGGRRYYLISKTARDLAGCKGQTLATDHHDAPLFIDRVLSGGQFKLADFTLVPMQRPLQTIRAVITGQAVCALIDDAQKDQLDRLKDKDDIRIVWESAALPPMPVVAFPDAPEAERAAFKKNLAALCAGTGQIACTEVGIDDLTAADDRNYEAVVQAYGQ